MSYKSESCSYKKVQDYGLLKLRLIKLRIRHFKKSINKCKEKLSKQNKYQTKKLVKF